jgi:hypothetical protein
MLVSLALELLGERLTHPLEQRQLRLAVAAPVLDGRSGPDQ